MGTELISRTTNLELSQHFYKVNKQDGGGGSPRPFNRATNRVFFALMPFHYNGSGNFIEKVLGFGFIFSS